VLLAEFVHRPGVHCGSTALADALQVRGLGLSEAMAFGLGAGLGFYYLRSPALSPTFWIQGRHWPLEETACEVLGAPLRVCTSDDAVEAWAGVREALERGLAPILSTDLRFLPYWKTSTPFTGHRVVLAGYDEGRDVAWLGDTDRPELQGVPLADLERARASRGQPLGYTGRLWMEVDAPPRMPVWKDAVADALRRQARHMLLAQDGHSGISALERFSEELPTWPDAARDDSDRSWCFRFAYQSIEKRGTGGGNFRLLYARFLEEAGRYHPAVERFRLDSRMREIASSWTRLAKSFKDLSEGNGEDVPREVAALARDIARDERRLLEDIAARIS